MTNTNTLFVKNSGYNAVVHLDSHVGIYSDTGLLLYVKKYSGAYEAKRAAHRVQDLLLTKGAEKFGFGVFQFLEANRITFKPFYISQHSKRAIRTVLEAPLPLKKYDPMLDMDLGEA